MIFLTSLFLLTLHFCSLSGEKYRYRGEKVEVGCSRLTFAILPPQYLLQFPQELDGPSGGDVGPVEEREAAAVDGEGVVGEGVICGAGEGRRTENYGL